MRAAEKRSSPPSPATSVGRWSETTKIKAWRESGLLYPSIVTVIVRTIKQEMVVSRVGEFTASEMQLVEDKLRDILAL